MIITDEQRQEIRRQCRLHGVDPETADAHVFAVAYRVGRERAAADIRALMDGWPGLPAEMRRQPWFNGLGGIQPEGWIEWAARIAAGGSDG